MREKEVTEDLRWAIVRMAPLLSIEKIEALTAVSRRQIQRILTLWRRTGEVTTYQDRRIRGRPRQLSADDVSVRYMLSPSTVQRY